MEEAQIMRQKLRGIVSREGVSPFPMEEGTGMEQCPPQKFNFLIQNGAFCVLSDT